MKPVKVSKVPRSTNILVFGDPGVGKSPLVGTSPKALILDADIEGTLSAALTGSDADVVQVQTHAEMTEILEMFQHDAKEIRKYEWVWLDSITQFQPAGLEDIMLDLVARKPHRQVWAPDKGEYQTNAVRITNWVRHMRALPINFGITAHAMQIEDRNGDELLMPAIQVRQMPSRIAGWMNIVGYLRPPEKNEEAKYNVLTCRHAKGVYGKNHFSSFKLMKDPTVPKIQRSIERVIEKKGGVLKKKTTRKSSRGRR